jgi:hypothetical protein
VRTWFQFDEILKVRRIIVHIEEERLTKGCSLKYCNELSMTIELDSTLAQAEVLFLSFAQLLADIERRQAEDKTASANKVRRRGSTTPHTPDVMKAMPIVSDNLKELLKAGRYS